MAVPNPKHAKPILPYWINEREKIRRLKDAGASPPWTGDHLMQSIYFCNVHREDDRVTKWIRYNLGPYSDSVHYEWLTCMARLFNWPDTIAAIMDSNAGTPMENVPRVIHSRQKAGLKVWGGAYVVTTHGQPMSKGEYCVGILRDALDSEALHLAAEAYSLQEAYELIMQLEGFASFMAAQVVADLKYTPGHRLSYAQDWYSFVAMGPGSKKGLNYFFDRPPKKAISSRQFIEEIYNVRTYLEDKLDLDVGVMCNQDLQNCLCEYSKYMRVLRGGRAKRKYDGGEQ